MKWAKCGCPSEGAERVIIGPLAGHLLINADLQYVYGNILQHFLISSYPRFGFFPRLKKLANMLSLIAIFYLNLKLATKFTNYKEIIFKLYLKNDKFWQLECDQYLIFKLRKTFSALFSTFFYSMLYNIFNKIG